MFTIIYNRDHTVLFNCPSLDQLWYITDLSNYISTYRAAIGNVKIHPKLLIFTGNRKWLCLNRIHDFLKPHLCQNPLQNVCLKKSSQKNSFLKLWFTLNVYWKYCSLLFRGYKELSTFMPISLLLSITEETRVAKNINFSEILSNL